MDQRPHRDADEDRGAARHEPLSSEVEQDPEDSRRHWESEDRPPAIPREARREPPAEPDEPPRPRRTGS